MHTADLKALLLADRHQIIDSLEAEARVIWDDRNRAEAQTITARQHAGSDAIRRARKPVGDRMRVG